MLLILLRCSYLPHCRLVVFNHSCCWTSRRISTVLSALPETAQLCGPTSFRRRRLWKLSISPAIVCRRKHWSESVILWLSVVLLWCQFQSEFLSWLVMAIAISESTKVHKSIKQNYNNMSGEDLRKRNVFRCRWQIGKDGDDCISGGSSVLFVLIYFLVLV